MMSAVGTVLGDIVLFVEGLFVCAVWFVFILMVFTLFASTLGNAYRENVPILDAINFNTGIIVLATFIIVFQLSRLNNTLKVIWEQNKTIGNNAVKSDVSFDESLSKLNERLKKVASTINEIKDIEQKISERPPVIIQKKESN